MPQTAHDTAVQQALAQNAMYSSELLDRQAAIERCLAGGAATAGVPSKADFLAEETHTAWLLAEQTRCQAALDAVRRAPPFQGLLRISLHSVRNLLQGKIPGKLGRLFTCCLSAQDSALDAPFLKLWLHGNGGDSQCAPAAATAATAAVRARRSVRRSRQWQWW